MKLWSPWSSGPPLEVSPDAVLASRSIVSLRQQMALDRNIGKCLLQAYYPVFCDVFPFKSEREGIEVYEDYLTDSEFDWDARVLFENGEVIGGVQYQHLPVLGTSVLFAEHFWLKGAGWYFDRKSFRSHDRFEYLGRHLEQVAREKGAKAIVWECNDLFQMSSQQKWIDRKAGLPPEKRLKLWGRYGSVLDVMYAQPRLAPNLDSVDFLMMCVRLLEKDFKFTGAFYRALFHNFVLTFNESPETDECYQRVMKASEVFGDNDVIPRIKFGEMRTFLRQELTVKASSAT